MVTTIIAKLVTGISIYCEHHISRFAQRKLMIRRPAFMKSCVMLVLLDAIFYRCSFNVTLSKPFNIITIRL